MHSQNSMYLALKFVDKQGQTDVRFDCKKTFRTTVSKAFFDMPTGYKKGTVAQVLGNAPTNVNEALKVVSDYSSERSCDVNRSMQLSYNRRKIVAPEVEYSGTMVRLANRTSGMRIRLATIDDATTIASVHKRSIEGGLNKFLPPEYVFGRSLKQFEDNWQSYFNSDWQLFVLVAIEDNQIVGFISIGLSQDSDINDSGLLEVSRFYVLPECGRKGIGKCLMDEAVKRLTEPSGHVLILWVFADNAPAKSFYQTYGFRFDGTTKSDFGVRLERYRLTISAKSAAY